LGIRHRSETKQKKTKKKPTTVEISINPGL
jgi:hypothetical protein